jgi:hypothetical protein
MVVESSVLWPLLQRLQERAEQLEYEAAALRAEVVLVAQTLDQPVATFDVNGETITVTASEVERVRAQMVKPRDERTLQELALLAKLRQHVQVQPEAARNARFWATIDAIHAAALSNGTAIDSPTEAAVDD